MNFKIDKDFASSAESLLNKLLYDNYLFDSGISKTSNSKDILKDHLELLDKNIFRNLDTNKYPEKDHERIRLFEIFVSELYKTYESLDSVEQFRIEVNKQVKRLDIKETNLFNFTSKIKTEKKRENRKKVSLRYKELSVNLLPKLQSIIENQNETCKYLGFESYSDQICKLNNTEIEQIEKLSKEFLNDTEYIYKDLIKWQLQHKLDIKIEDAGHDDLEFLFNSYELKDYFKQTSLESLSTKFLYDIGIDLGTSISFDVVSRAAKNCQAKSYPAQIPQRIFASIYRFKTIEDYESILGELGKSLFFSSVNIEETFENKRLIDPITLETFKILFQDFVFEQSWLKKYLRIDTGKNFMGFLYLKKLFHLRSLCVDVLLNRTINENNSDDSLQQITEMYLNNMYVQPNENKILFDLALSDINPYIRYKACLIETYLKEFMTDKFDEEWWREAQAGNQLMKWWNLCSDLTPFKLQVEIGIPDLNNSRLIRKFEQVL